MPITVQYLTDEYIVILKLQGVVSSDELDTLLMQEITPFILENADQPVHIIFDAKEYQSDFKEFIDYIGRASQRRVDQSVPPNLVQHFVGSNAWVSSFRTWAKKKFNEEMNSFLTVERALEHIRQQNN